MMIVSKIVVQVTRFSLPFSVLVYGLHIRAPLYPCSRSRWADKTGSKIGRDFQRAIVLKRRDSIYIYTHISYIYFYVFLLFSIRRFVRHSYTIDLYFVFPIGSIVSVYIRYRVNVVCSNVVQAWKKWAKRRESGREIEREIHIGGFIMNFAWFHVDVSFIRCLRSIFFLFFPRLFPFVIFIRFFFLFPWRRNERMNREEDAKKKRVSIRSG